MIQKQSNYQSANHLATYFGKKYGHFLYSGCLALELALRSFKLAANEVVLLPSTTCYRVLLAVVRAGLRPVMVTPEDGLSLSAEDVEKALKKYSVKVVIAVHTYGFACDVPGIRKVCGKRIKIIEDAAQAWDITYSGHHLGSESDVVMTSFAINKPLSYGVGGALFFDDLALRKYLDNQDTESRSSQYPIMPYSLPREASPEIKSLIATANKRVAKQRRVAAVLQKNLSKYSSLQLRQDALQSSSWHRFPVWLRDEALYQSTIKTLQQLKIGYDLPHRLKLYELPLAQQAQAIHLDYSRVPNYNILLKTQQNTVAEIRKWLKALPPSVK